MERNVLADKFLNGDYYIIAKAENEINKIEISVTLLVNYHNLEYHADVAVKIEGAQDKRYRNHANIFVTREDNLPSMTKLLSEINRLAKQSKLFRTGDKIKIEFYKVGNSKATRVYKSCIG